MTQLRLDWCTHAAARYAVEHWHYSRRLPMSPIVRIGVWEDGEFVGAILFGRGASLTLSQSLGLEQIDVAELTRVALRAHSSPVSRIISIALRMYRTHSPGTRVIVSFADPDKGHHGGIYQALGWLYTGTSHPTKLYFHEGRWKHVREISGGAFGGARKRDDGVRGLPVKVTPGKHRYVLPLTDEMRERVASLAKQYPKREPATRAGNGSPVGTTDGEGGAKPTPALR